VPNVNCLNELSLKNLEKYSIMLCYPFRDLSTKSIWKHNYILPVTRYLIRVWTSVAIKLQNIQTPGIWVILILIEFLSCRTSWYTTWHVLM